MEPGDQGRSWSSGTSSRRGCTSEPFTTIEPGWQSVFRDARECRVRVEASGAAHSTAVLIAGITFTLRQQGPPSESSNAQDSTRADPFTCCPYDAPEGLEHQPDRPMNDLSRTHSVDFTICLRPARSPGTSRSRHLLAQCSRRNNVRERGAPCRVERADAVVVDPVLLEAGIHIVHETGTHGRDLHERLPIDGALDGKSGLALRVIAPGQVDACDCDGAAGEFGWRAAGTGAGGAATVTVTDTVAAPSTPVATSV